MHRVKFQVTAFDPEDHLYEDTDRYASGRYLLELKKAVDEFFVSIGMRHITIHGPVVAKVKPNEKYAD